jgi:hypothetical protein
LGLTVTFVGPGGFKIRKPDFSGETFQVQYVRFQSLSYLKGSTVGRSRKHDEEERGPGEETMYMEGDAPPLLTVGGGQGWSPQLHSNHFKQEWGDATASLYMSPHRVPVISSPPQYLSSPFLASATSPGHIGLAFECDINQDPVITNVALGSPAHNAGLLQGDRILSVCRTNVKGKSADEMNRLVRQSFNDATNLGGKMLILVQRVGANGIPVLEEKELGHDPMVASPAPMSMPSAAKHYEPIVASSSVFASPPFHGSGPVGLLVGADIQEMGPVLWDIALIGEPKKWKESWRVQVHKIEGFKDQGAGFVRDKLDPYVKVIVGNHEFKTKVKDNAGGTVIFDESFSFQQPQDHKVTFQVWDSESFRSDELLGHANVDLRTPEVFTLNWPITIANQGQTAGKIIVTFSMSKEEVKPNAAPAESISDLKAQISSLEKEKAQLVREKAQLAAGKANFAPGGKGSSVEAFSQGEWWPATVLEQRPDQIKVHFVGFSAAEDVWIALNSGKLRATARQPPKGCCEIS